MGRKHIPLSQAVAQKETTFCFDCGEQKAKIAKSPYNLLSVTVSDFPHYKCVECGSETHRISVSIAVENLVEKYSLMGTFTTQQLLQIEAHGG